MERDFPFKIALASIHGIGSATFKQLLNHVGSAEQVFNAPARVLTRIPGIGAKTAQLILSTPSPERRGASILNNCEKQKIELIYCREKKYPHRLNQINDGPVFLYAKGDMNLNQEKAINIVGTRKATPYGKKAVDFFVEAWAEHKPLIISGLAYGIDIQAHKAALNHGLSTIGVLASSPDYIYPSTHKEVAKQMLENGGLLSEYPPGTDPDPTRFPARNRIIAGLSDATIVIEAAARGGALITAEFGHGYGREVFALPGRVTDHYSEGCNSLIRSQKAIPLIRPDDLERNLNWDILLRKAEKKKNISQITFESTDEKEIVNQLVEYPDLVLDELSWKSQIPIPKLAGILLELELKGIVKPLPGNRFALCP